jgi:hypothetical protein
VNSVEIMMPVFSREALKVSKDLFAESISGWGIDLAIGKLIRQQLGTLPAVLDSVVASHVKQVDTRSGAFYRMLYQENLYPEIEKRNVVEKYDAERTFFELPDSNQGGLAEA